MKLLLLLSFALVASAQPQFEVASIRIAPCPCRSIHNFTSSGPNVTFEAYRWIELFTEAYDLKFYEADFPDALAKVVDLDTFFTIQAKAEGDSPRTRAEFRAMLQTLLTDRFHLKFHRETRETQVYAMVIGKGGIKFKESKPETQRSLRGTVNGRLQKLSVTGMSMDIFSTNLGIRPVLDRTGLTGVYDLIVEFTPEARINNNPQPDDVSIFTAIQEIGLRLEPQKAPIEVLVVDSIEKPSEN